MVILIVRLFSRFWLALGSHGRIGHPARGMRLGLFMSSSSVTPRRFILGIRKFFDLTMSFRFGRGKVFD
jgi:hypothetical protein